MAEAAIEAAPQFPEPISCVATIDLGARNKWQTVSRRSCEGRELKTRIALIIMPALFAWVAVATAQDRPWPEPQVLLDAAVEQLQSAASFRMSIQQTGEPYQLALSFDGVNMLPATLASADAQIVSPDELHINAQLRLLIPLWMNVYSRAERQWLSFPAGAPWILLPAFDGFDISRLLAPDDGIEKVMSGLIAPRIADDEALVDERLAWRIEANAAGDAVEGLLFGFIDPEDDVEIEAYIATESGRLALLEILMLETVGDPDKAPSVWHIKFHDYDGPRAFESPA